MESGMYGIQFKAITYDNGVKGEKDGIHYRLYSYFWRIFDSVFRHNHVFKIVFENYGESEVD